MAPLRRKPFVPRSIEALSGRYQVLPRGRCAFLHVRHHNNSFTQPVGIQSLPAFTQGILDDLPRVIAMEIIHQAQQMYLTCADGLETEPGVID